MNTNTVSKLRKARLSEKMVLLLIEGVKSAGNFQPVEVLCSVQECMTHEEYQQAEAFLTWIVANNRKFGYNLPLVWAEYQSTL